MTYRSKRARILLALQRQLETISVANGYAQDVKKVTTKVKLWSETPAAETPVLYIVDENTQYNYFPSKLSERSWFVAVYGVMKDQDQLQMEELIADIEECISKNRTLGFDGEYPGPLVHFRITQVVTDNQLFAEIENSNLFKVVFELRYTVCTDNVR